MHIEPGIIPAGKILLANLTDLAILGRHFAGVIRSPVVPLRTLLAAGFFSLFMQAFHLPVGPSELHFVGAMAIYLTFGYLPTLFGFALGLTLQGWLFEPRDLIHLAINSLSLIVPLMAVHHTLGQRLIRGSAALSWRAILRLDGCYYAGVTTMVGFWLLLGEVETPLVAWATFAASYLGVVLLEPVVTMTAVRLLKRQEAHPLMDLCCQVRELRFACQTKGS
ncbi:MAG: energy-coupling factor ABC transporter permease [Magnetococcales bacterium]|nr:energy-coupling factor ABC transporter permease [Magnetococcales bacterium]